MKDTKTKIEPDDLDINILLPQEKLETLTRRQRKKQETRWRIFDAAVTLMKERGFDDVKIEDICEKADVARATYFKHFSTKASLMWAYHERQVEHIRGKVEASSSSAEDRLKLIARLITEYGELNAAFSQRLFQAFTEDHGDEFKIDVPDTGLSGIVAKVIREGQTSGEFDTVWPADLVAASLIASWLAVLKIKIRRNETFGTGDRATILSLFLKGLSN